MLQDLHKLHLALSQNGVDNPRLEAELLLSHILNIPREKLYSLPHLQSLSHDQSETLQKLVARRIDHEPIAYILNKKMFWRDEFYVDPNVLIPRPDTELIMETALELSKHQTFNSILDLCSGSGCLGISLAKEFKNARVEMWDIHEKTIAVAKKNAEKILSNNTHRTIIRQIDVLSFVP